MSIADLLNRAKQIYESRLRSELERTHPDFFVAIEPESGDYFLGRTLSEAAQAAGKVHLKSRTAVLRIGQATTLHIGATFG